MELPLRRRAFALNSKSFFLLIGTFVVSTLMVATLLLGVPLWQVGSIVLILWIPLVGYVMSIFYRLYGAGVAAFFLLVVGQAAHLVEHIAQMVQLHFLGLKGVQASGIIGQLNNEWVHLIWNSWVLAFCFLLFYWFRKNPWIYVLFIFGVWHEAEHIYIINKYIQTGLAGNPGLIAKGGFFFGGLPIARPDLHFFYAVFEETVIILAFALEVRRAQKKLPRPTAAPAAAS